MLTVGYVSMLLVMTYNVGVFFAITLGITTGHLMFAMVGSPSLPKTYQ